MDQPQDTLEPTIGNMIRELQRTNHRLSTLEEYLQGVHNTPLLINLRHEKEEVNHSHQGMSSDDKLKPNKFGVTYQKKISPPQQHDFRTRINLPEFDGSMDPNEFIN